MSILTDNLLLIIVEGDSSCTIITWASQSDVLTWVNAIIEEIADLCQSGTSFVHILREANGEADSLEREVSPDLRW